MKQSAIKVAKTSKTDKNQEIEEEEPNNIMQRLSRNVPQAFSVLQSIEPIYSGGKIQFVSSADVVQIFSTYNYSIKVSSYTQGKFSIEQTIQHHNEDIANFVVNQEEIITFTKNYLLRLSSFNPSIQVKWTQKIEPLFPIDMAVSPEGIFVALGCTNGQVRIINVKKGSTNNEVRFHQGSVLKVAWSPVIKKFHLVTAGDDQKIILFDVISNTCICQFSGHQSRITSVSFINQGANLISTSSDQTLKLWDLANLRLKSQKQFDIDLESGCQLSLQKQEYFAAGTLDGRLLIGNATKFTDDDVSIFDFLEGQEILKLVQPNLKIPQIFVITNELHIYVININVEKNRLNINNEQCLLGYNDEVLDVRFEQRKNNMNNFFKFETEYLVMVTNSSFLKIVELGKMKILTWKAHNDIIMTAHFIERFILSGAKDNLIKVWKFQSIDEPPSLIVTYSGHSNNIVSVSFSPKDLSLVASISTDLTLKLWDFQHYIKKSTQGIEIIINLIQESVEVNQSLRSVQAHEKDINTARFAPNQKLIATCSQDRSIKIWDVGTLMLTLQLKGHKRGVWDVQFSPVEKVIASASGDGTLKVWNLTDGNIIHNFEGHNTGLLRVNWLSFGLQLISSDINGVIKLWNLKKQICTATFDKHEGKVWALDVSPFSADGKVYLASGANDSVFHIWSDITEEETQQKQQEKQKNQLNMQQFQNQFRLGNFKDAALIAFNANFTKCFIDAINELFKDEDKYNSDINEISKELFSKQTDNYLSLLIKFNQSKKTFLLSQALFQRSVKQIPIIKFEQNKIDILKQKLNLFKSSTLQNQLRLKNQKKNVDIIDFLLEKKQKYL